MLKNTRIVKVLAACFAIVLIQSCSFQLRETTQLPANFKALQIIGVADSDGLLKALQFALEEAGGEISSTSKTKLRLSNIREGRRIVAYNSERKARIYLISLKFNYTITADATGNEQSGSFATVKQRINLDKTFLYDADFALGKVKEEQQIRESLYAEAARLILLRLKYVQ